MNNNDFWSPEIWKQINGEPPQSGQVGGNLRGAMATNGQPQEPGVLRTQMGLIRVAQKIFPTTVRGNDDPIRADTIDNNGIPSAGTTKAVVTLTKKFQLAEMHIQDPELTMTMNQVMLVAQALALAEDALFFQGKTALATQTDPSNVGDVMVAGARTLDEGLLGLAKNQTIQVNPMTSTGGSTGGSPGGSTGGSPGGSPGGSVFGVKTLDAVKQGIGIFGQKFQSGPFALILDPDTYLDTQVAFQTDSASSPGDVIKDILVEGGGHFVLSPGLPKDTGLLAALGSRATQLYIGTGPIAQFNFPADGNYFFTAKQTIQFHNVDVRSLIKLKFNRPSS